MSPITSCAKPTQWNTNYFAPPLIISEEQISECCDIIDRTIQNF